MRFNTIIEFVIIFLAIGNFTLCSGQSMPEYFLHGKVKSCLVLFHSVNINSESIELGDLLDYGHLKGLFDRNGNLKTSEYLNSKFAILEKTLPAYKAGKVIKEVVYNGKGKIESYTIYNYVSKREMEFERFIGDSVITFRGKVYFKKNRAIQLKMTQYRNNEAKEKICCFYEYDKNSNLLLFKQTNETEQIMYIRKFEYLEFDDNKNWTKRFDYYPEYGSDKPKKIVVRKIEYYQ